MEALKQGDHHEITAWLDNDNVSFMEDDRDLLALDPHEVQEQALALLGIRVERV